MTPEEQLSDLRINVAELAVRIGSGTLTCIGLGSCVAIALYDPLTRIGGMAHVMLPDESMARDRSKPGKFPGPAVAALLSEMEAAGAKHDRIRARLVGGASMFASLIPIAGMNIGSRNVESCRAALEAEGIPVVAEDVGSDYGRTVVFSVDTGQLEVRSLKRKARVL